MRDFLLLSSSIPALTATDRRRKRVGDQCINVAAGQRLQEREQVVYFRIAQPERTDQRIENFIRHAAPIVEQQHVTQLWQRPVMHVRRRQCDITQSRRAVAPAVGR